MKNELLENVRWSENVIVVDADYVDSVAFNLIVNFERMIGRRIPPADMARWVECVALDGGLRQGDHETQVVLLHDKGKRAMENFTPADYSTQLEGKAFKGNLGEFVFGAYPVESLVSKEEFLVDVVSLVCNQKEVKRVMVVPDVDKCYDMLRHALRHVDDDKRVTLFAMQPLTGGNFRQEILGYSLMSALGIKADEIKE
ncbi:MAG: hypothetical protein MRZ57_06705 [Bacteroidales bacterium]|nr:hypothetical protein [Bacteroidales bacterium]MDY2692722.1 DUF6621 family protein [Prevotella sp.]MDY6026779.1 DUF6621 family protein [Prevotella sp.]